MKKEFVISVESLIPKSRCDRRFALSPLRIAYG
jgi:hypothetical protein